MAELGRRVGLKSQGIHIRILYDTLSGITNKLIYLSGY